MYVKKCKIIQKYFKKLLSLEEYLIYILLISLIKYLINIMRYCHRKIVLPRSIIHLNLNKILL
jgi:hypothetical protein